jgi:transcriptional regulator with XRE-family HTH domain
MSFTKTCQVVPSCAKVGGVQRQINGAAIRAIREPLGIPQGELAKRAGISPSHMNKIEKGVETSKIETVVRIARALGVSLDAIAPVIEPAKS